MSLSFTLNQIEYFIEFLENGKIQFYSFTLQKVVACYPINIAREDFAQWPEEIREGIKGFLWLK